MKRLLFILMTLAGVMTAQADDYPYLTFETSDGTKTSVAVGSLTITISGNTLTAGGQTFCLSELSKMYFSKSDATGIHELTTTLPANGKVEVFTMAGVSLGTFASLTAARQTLKQGVYILKTDGQTLKTVVK